MRNPLLATLLVALLLASGAPGGGTVSADRSAAARAVTTVGLNPGQERLVHWAVQLFHEARLPLPPVTFVHERSTAPCLGSTGAQRFADGRSTISICTDDAGPTEEFLFVHELAHAWDHAHLDDARRAAFLRLRGLRSWWGLDPTGADWHERGAEHAAEILTWGLMDRPIRMAYIDHHTCAELLAGYRVLVGRRPPHGYTDYC